jgi:hypothetical protein
MAVLIDEKLCRVFGPDRVFRASRSLPAGVAFPAELVAEATNCAAMLVVIGRDWLKPGDNGRRIDAPADWVRTEIELALASGRPVVPVLVGDRPRLTAKDTLPATISTLVEHNYVRVHHRSTETDLLNLVDKLRPHVDSDAPPRPTDSARLATFPPTQRSSDVRLGPATLNNRYYGDSIVFRPQLFANDVRGAIAFNLGRQYRRLETTAGVLDDAAEPGQVGVFQVLADGVMRMETTARHGEPRILNINVTDVLSLRLVAYRPGTTGHPALAGVRMAGGQSNKLPELAWGNPVVHP